MTKFDWKPIETAPREEGVYLFGYDSLTAREHQNPQAGLCLISWFEPSDGDDEDMEAGWIVQPFHEGLDVVYPSEVSHWAPIPMNLPSGAVQ